MEKKLKNVIGAPIGKSAVAYVSHLEQLQQGPEAMNDDQSLNNFDNDALEILRQLMEMGGFNRRKNNFFVSVKDILSYLVQ